MIGEKSSPSGSCEGCPIKLTVSNWEWQKYIFIIFFALWCSLCCGLKRGFVGEFTSLALARKFRSLGGALRHKAYHITNLSLCGNACQGMTGFVSLSEGKVCGTGTPQFKFCVRRTTRQRAREFVMIPLRPSKTPHFPLNYNTLWAKIVHSDSETNFVSRSLGTRQSAHVSRRVYGWLCSVKKYFPFPSYVGFRLARNQTNRGNSLIRTSCIMIWRSCSLHWISQWGDLSRQCISSPFSSLCALFLQLHRMEWQMQRGERLWAFTTLRTEITGVTMITGWLEIRALMTGMGYTATRTILK